MVAYFVVDDPTGSTIQMALFPIMMGLVLWFLAREAFTYDADEMTVTFHLAGRR